jgi:hypothetical protein
MAVVIDTSALLNEVRDETSIHLKFGTVIVKVLSPFEWPSKLPADAAKWIDVMLTPAERKKFVKATGTTAANAGILFYRVYLKAQAAATGATAGE